MNLKYKRGTFFKYVIKERLNTNKEMTSIDKIDLEGKRIFLRTDLNVPIVEGRLTDMSRLTAVKETIEHIITHKASCVLASHIGRPNGHDESLSTELLIPYLEAMLGISIKFAKDSIGKNVDDAKQQLKPGEILLLENLRFYKEEYENDMSFAESLSAFCDVYINDAFATCHRSHASLVSIVKFFKEDIGIGIRMKRELNALDRILTYPKSPFTIVVGGSKVSTKIGLLKSLASIVDNILIGGAMANTFIYVRDGCKGSRIPSEDCINAARDLLEGEYKAKIQLPIDGISFGGADCDNSEPMFDIGLKTCELFDSIINASKTIIWNGPMGMFENELYTNGTRTIAQSIAAADAFSIFGGGDTMSAVNAAGIPPEKFGFVSTGGGALLYAIENGCLPSIQTMQQFRSS